MTTQRWTDEMLDKLAESVKENNDAIRELRQETKEQSIRFFAYQQASQWVVNLARVTSHRHHHHHRQCGSASLRTIPSRGKGKFLSKCQEMYSITLQSHGLLVAICYNVFTNKKGLTTVPRPQPVYTEFADHCLV